MVRFIFEKVFCLKRNKSENSDVVDLETGDKDPPLRMVKRKVRRPTILPYLLFYTVICLLLAGVYTGFLCFLTNQQNKYNIRKIFIIYVVTLILLCVGFCFEALIMKRAFIKMSEKRSRTSRVLRIRLENESDFVEAEVDHGINLTYDNVLEICCKELGLANEEVRGIRKLPQIKVRNDGDVKRFNNVEYLELIKM